MTENIVVMPTYGENKKNTHKKINYNSFAVNDDYSYDDNYEKIERILSPEVDIFTEIDAEVYENENVKCFLNELRRCLQEWDKEELSKVVLPKLIVTEHTPESIVLEWIFSYFRLYFSFDLTEGDYYGEVMGNLESEVFRNEFRKMKREDYPLVAEAEIAYAIMMSSGDESR